jgi:DNA-binding GntR family transcriptional regulator
MSQWMGSDRTPPEASLSDDVYRCLKEYILNEVIRPPDRLQIGQLSRHFGVSITPIREALIRLAAEHIVELKPGRGFFYKEFVPDEQIKTYELLYFILKVSLEDRAGRPPNVLPNVSLTGPPLDRWPLATALAREELYARIVANSGNALAVELVRNLAERTRTSRMLFLEQHGTKTKALDDRRKLDALVQAGENRAAIDLLRQQFEAKAANMHSLANERQRRIYDVYPLLRPSSASQFR